ncbi:MAG: hypothetical protein H7A44_12045 [Opitutaceae bacterium]|nr:hypothetical protein [Cephaloticoccus sp.]MCP5531159.1 hypothetical protein [Opitutaceae bacterium]
MNAIIYVILILGLFAGSGCERLLDILPGNIVIPGDVAVINKSTSTIEITIVCAGGPIANSLPAGQAFFTDRRKVKDPHSYKVVRGTEEKTFSQADIERVKKSHHSKDVMILVTNSSIELHPRSDNEKKQPNSPVETTQAVARPARLT